MQNATCQNFMASAIRPLMAACWLGWGAAAAAQEATAVAAADNAPRDECEITITAAPLQYRQFDKVEIAGVAITDPQAKLPQPVQVLCHRQVERSNATHTGELLEQLPSLLHPRSDRLSGPFDVTAVHGRASGTLVLLNGQRLPAAGPTGWSGTTGGVDLRFLPMSAIDRIEVQTPGASSAQGSDGTAGIVNIITRKTRGTTVGVEYLGATRGQGDGQGLNVSWGQGKLHTDGYVLQLHAGLSQRQPLLLWPDTQAVAVAPAPVRQQWFMEGEWSLGTQWIGFAHLLGQHESPPNHAPGLSWAAGQAASGNSPGRWPWVQNEQLGMHQWQVGLKGPWQQWDVLASASSGQATQQGQTQLAMPDAPLDAVMQARLDRLQSLPAWSGQRHDARLQTLSVQARRELDSTIQGPRTLSLGWQWRQESLATQLDAPGETRWQGQRQQWGLHSELKIPVAEHHEVIAALRHDHAQDVGSATTGQLAWKWRPATPFLMRASMGTGFRMPGLDQLSPHITRTWWVWDPVRQSEVTVQRRGRSDLQAEQATHASWGFRLEPHPRWTLGADLWQIDVRRAIGYPGPVALRASVPNCVGVAPCLDSVATNLGRSHQRGMDYDTEWRVAGDAGLLRLSLKGTLYLQSSLEDAATGRRVSDLAYFSGASQAVTPRHKVVVGASLERANWVLMSGWRFRSAYREAWMWSAVPDSNAARQVPAFWRLDLGAQWALNRQVAISAWLQDATDRGRAQVLSSALAFQGGQVVPLEDMGRSVKLRADYRF